MRPLLIPRVKIDCVDVVVVTAKEYRSLSDSRITEYFVAGFETPAFGSIGSDCIEVGVAATDIYGLTVDGRV